ncbi:MAG: hypothetical protein K9L30_03585 [Desulfobacterales bacterium]|nr:hypothetical protein [Desulfobacterales bacterium]
MKQIGQRPKKIVIDLNLLNTLNTEGCPACGGKFSLGEMTVPAFGKWNGLKLVHEKDTVFNNKTNSYIDKNMLGEVKS